MIKKYSIHDQIFLGICTFSISRILVCVPVGLVVGGSREEQVHILVRGQGSMLAGQAGESHAGPLADSQDELDTHLYAKLYNHEEC